MLLLGFFLIFLIIAITVIANKPSNPVIEKMEGLTTFWEACASCLNNMGLVLRPYKVTISYMDIEGNILNKVFNEKLKPIAIDNDYWEIIKTEFNNSLKEKKKIYNYVEETYDLEEVFNRNEKNTEITSSSNELEEIFDDIIVYN